MEPLEIVRQFFEEVWNGRRLDLLGQLFDPNCVTHQLRSGPGPTESVPRGPAVLRHHISHWIESFPDIRFTIDHQVALGADVVSWITISGTHRGPWQGIPPTNREIIIRTVTQHRIENGLIVEDWVIVETLGLFQQLGVVPPTAELLPPPAQKT